MSKISGVLFAVPLACVWPAQSANADVLGPAADVCVNGSGAAILVKLNGLKSRTGPIRVRTFNGSQPKTWFDKKQVLKRIEIPMPSSGSVEICVPVPGPGGYVIDVRHDINKNGDTDKADGAGVSGNPNVSLFDFLLKKRPPASKVVVNVGEGVATVPITVKYIQGGSFKPIQTASR